MHYRTLVHALIISSRSIDPIAGAYVKRGMLMRLVTMVFLVAVFVFANSIGARARDIQAGVLEVSGNTSISFIDQEQDPEGADKTKTDTLKL